MADDPEIDPTPNYESLPGKVYFQMLMVLLLMNYLLDRARGERNDEDSGGRVEPDWTNLKYCVSGSIFTFAIPASSFVSDSSSVKYPTFSSNSIGVTGSGLPDDLKN
jgi:hypothetical protein